jgi:hypothetical protein
MSDSETKTQLRKAQKQLSRGNFQEARSILITLDHPEAQRVLADLDEIISLAPTAIHPKKKPAALSSRPDWLFPLLVFSGLLFCALLFLVAYS